MDIMCNVGNANVISTLQSRKRGVNIGSFSSGRQNFFKISSSGCRIVKWKSALRCDRSDIFSVLSSSKNIFSFCNVYNGCGSSRCVGLHPLSCFKGNGTPSDANLVGNTGDDSLRAGKNDILEVTGDETHDATLEELQETLLKATKELETARVNSTLFEEQAQRISEVAIACMDESTSASNEVNIALEAIENVISEEVLANEAVQKAKMAMAEAESRLQMVSKSFSGGDLDPSHLVSGEDPLAAAQNEVKLCQENLKSFQSEVFRLLNRKEELQKEIDRLNEIAEKTRTDNLKAEEEVANVMLLAEQAVAFEIEAAQKVDDAEIALRKAEKALYSTHSDSGDASSPRIAEMETLGEGGVSNLPEQRISFESDASSSNTSFEEKPNQSSFELYADETVSNGSGKMASDSSKDIETESGKLMGEGVPKKQETQSSQPKPSLNKSSRFFPASFFSFTEDDTELSPSAVFQNAVNSLRKHITTVVVGVVLCGAGFAFFSTRPEKSLLLIPQSKLISSSIQEVSLATKPLIASIRSIPEEAKKLLDMIPPHETSEEEVCLLDMLWLLLFSVIFVPIFQKIPGGSPVLGYLAAGILIGPYGLSIIRNVHETKAIAEFGVVFLLFNIGLELSVERLISMKKYVFGLGSAQVLVTAVAAGIVGHMLFGLSGPAAIVIGNGLALSSTAVVLQVLQERGESTSRHGRATFSVLLFQDLAVVVLLILIPLISPSSLGGGVGVQSIVQALGLAGIKAVISITAIVAWGRLLLRPIYRQIAENRNPEIFSATTLLVILGTSLLTARAGLSMALGAFLAGLLIAETEFSLQVESDIAPYRGLLLGLFFMTVGMSIDPKLLIPNFRVIAGTLVLLIGAKTLLVTVLGKMFGMSFLSAMRVGLLLAPGGEFAFVAFGEAVNQNIMSPQWSSLLFLVVGISMALTPYLAAGGQLLASRFEAHDVRSLLPDESETEDLQDHIIICGFGRVGQIIAQLLSERLIPFVALDVRSDRVTIGRALDLPVYFGDAGSREVLHKVGAQRACAAAITLDSPGANYRAVWALSKYFPNVKTFVRAHDVDHGLNLEKAGATAVVPESLEPSLQLAAAVLSQAKMPMSEIATTINEFRSRHLSELTELSEASGSSLGYGFSSKPKAHSPDSNDDSSLHEGSLAF